MASTESIVNFLKKYDFTFFGTALSIFVIGFLNLYSATVSKEVYGSFPIYINQLIYFFLAVGAGFLISFIHPKNFDRFAYAFYTINLMMLIYVIVWGKVGMGAQRWISLGFMRFQPSEMTKVAVVLALSRWFSHHHADREIGLRELFIPILITCVPTFLIIKQPDLGTGLLVLLIFSFMTFFRRLRLKTILILSLVGVVIGPVVYKFGLKDYQRQRILTFINPKADARGTGYNAIQSEIAIGSGKVFGKGFQKSSQASLNYLPENHTDFVFSVFNEEHGFFGAIVLIALYVIFFLRLIWLSTNVLKVFDSLCVIGLMSIFFWHTFVNMCMVMGLMPIVGLPLPFMSYGGSSLMTFGICCGILTSISNTKNLF